MDINPAKLSFVTRLKMEEAIIELADSIASKTRHIVKNIHNNRIKEKNEICYRWDIILAINCKNDTLSNKCVVRVYYNRFCSRKIEIRNPFAIGLIATKEQLEAFSKDTGIDWTNAKQGTIYQMEEI